MTKSASYRSSADARGMYELVLSPVITEKATTAVGAQPGHLPRAARRDQAGDQGRGRRPVQGEGPAVNTLVVVKGKKKRVPRRREGRRGDFKKAIVTLAEGLDDRRDDGGLRRMAWLSRTFKPVTPVAQRQLVLVDRSELHKGKPVKSLDRGQDIHRRPQQPRAITVRWRGGGSQAALPLIDFKRRKFDVPATVERLEYDPNRTAFIALIKYADGELAYILAPQRLKAGDQVIAGEKVDVKPGNAMPLRNDAGRHDRPQRRDEDRQGRPDRPLGRHLCPAGRQATRAMPCCGCPRASSAWCAASAWRRSARSATRTRQNIKIGKAGPHALAGPSPSVTAAWR